MTIPEALQIGLQHHQCGRLNQAENIYRQILQLDPHHTDALHLSGVIAHQCGKNDIAINLISRAIELNESMPVYHSNLGNAFKGIGKLEEAIKCYHKAISLQPDFVDAHSNLGTVLHAQGHLEKAVICFKHALSYNPDSIQALYNLGTIYKKLGSFKDASDCLKKALSIKPEFVEAHCNLGNVYQNQGNLDKAIASYRQAISYKEDYAEAYCNLAAALTKLGNFSEAEPNYRQAIRYDQKFSDAYLGLGSLLQKLDKYDQAVQVYEQLISFHPDCANAYSNLGTVLHKSGKFEDALACFHKALTYKPDLAEAHYNLANALRLQGKNDAAADCYAKAIEHRPSWADAHNNLANVLQEKGQLEAAEYHLQKALSINSQFSEAQSNLGNVYKHQGKSAQAIACYRKALQLDPENLLAHSNLLFSLSAFPGCTPDNYLEEALKFGKMAHLLAYPYTHWTHYNNEKGSKRLRVGLVSGDFKSHPVSYFLESVLDHLDKDKIELVAYSSRLIEDELTARIKPYFAAWNSIVGLSNKAAAAKIYDDNIDILIDLAGHTAHNRLPLFAWKPAPVQVSWLGYFASTGVAGIDYLLADPVSVPREHKLHFTEKIEYLPDTRLCFTPLKNSPPVATLPALNNGFITFGCFQTLPKLNDEVLNVWGRILKALPQSRLLLQNKQMSYPSSRKQVMSQLEHAEINPEQVILRGPVSRAEYLQVYAEVDVVLDTFPYPGGTTTCEALWMGVPTVTLAGETMLARQGASLLMAAGLPEWIAWEVDEYITKSLEFTADLSSLSSLRNGLRQQVSNSALFDAHTFARNIEKALQRMWQESVNNTKSE